MGISIEDLSQTNPAQAPEELPPIRHEGALTPNEEALIMSVDFPVEMEEGLREAFRVLLLNKDRPMYFVDLNRATWARHGKRNFEASGYWMPVFQKQVNTALGREVIRIPSIGKVMLSYEAVQACLEERRQPVIVDGDLPTSYKGALEQSGITNKFYLEILTIFMLNPGNELWGLDLQRAISERFERHRNVTVIQMMGFIYEVNKICDTEDDVIEVLTEGCYRFNKEAFESSILFMLADDTGSAAAFEDAERDAEEEEQYEPDEPEPNYDESQDDDLPVYGIDDDDLDALIEEEPIADEGPPVRWSESLSGEYTKAVDRCAFNDPRHRTAFTILLLNSDRWMTAEEIIHAAWIRSNFQHHVNKDELEVLHGLYNKVLFGRIEVIERDDEGRYRLSKQAFEGSRVFQVSRTKVGILTASDIRRPAHLARLTEEDEEDIPPMSNNQIDHRLTKLEEIWRELYDSGEVLKGLHWIEFTSWEVLAVFPKALERIEALRESIREKNKQLSSERQLSHVYGKLIELERRLKTCIQGGGQAQSARIAELERNYGEALTGIFPSPTDEEEEYVSLENEVLRAIQRVQQMWRKVKYLNI